MYNCDKYFEPPYNPVLFGRRRDDIGYLTIGIPSVYRPNTETVYLFGTLDSIIQNTKTTEKSEVTVVVLLADLNATYTDYMADELYSRYQNYCDSGFIHVLKTTPDIYPDLEHLPQTFKDAKPRIKWRAKQNIDFAYLTLYSRNISRYYIQLEDDVITASDYLNYTKYFINTHTSHWSLLEFSKLGFIGKLFKSSDLNRLAYYMLLLFDVMPGDLLLGHFRTIMLQKKPIHSRESLFQHVGKFSSLKNKIMPSLDKTFKDAGKVNLSINDVPKGDNPSAVIDTNLEQYESFEKEYAYDGSDKYFWAKSPSASTYYCVLFRKPFNITRIIISTGDSEKKTDSLDYGKLLLATNADTNLEEERTQQSQCGQFNAFADLIGGEVDTDAMGKPLPQNVICLKIAVTRPIRHWVIIRKIIILL